ncbi:MAG: hypothetical protein U0271_15455 [Polyangiaceae bacterium]
MSSAELRSPHGPREVAEVVATLAVIGLIGLVTSLSFCSSAPRPVDTSRECDAILSRFVELRMRAANPKATPSQIALRQTSARRDEGAPLALAACEKHLTEANLSCAKSATNADDLERCFQ